LSGDFGTVQLGRLSTFQNIYSNLDPWKYNAGWNGLAWGVPVDGLDAIPVLGGIANAQSRMNNAIAYSTPEWSGFSARAMYSAAGESKVDVNGASESQYAWDLGLRYAVDGMYAQYSYTAGKNASLLGKSGLGDKDLDPNDDFFAGTKSRMNYFEVGYDANNLLFALTYVDNKLEDNTGSDGYVKSKALGFNLAYTMGQFVPHFQYAHGWEAKSNDGDLKGSDYNQYILGLDYLLSKRTKAHVSAGWIKSGDAPADTVVDGTDFSGKTWLKGATYGVGLTHLF